MSCCGDEEEKLRRKANQLDGPKHTHQADTHCSLEFRLLEVLRLLFKHLEAYKRTKLEFQELEFRELEIQNSLMTGLVNSVVRSFLGRTQLRETT